MINLKKKKKKKKRIFHAIPRRSFPWHLQGNLRRVRVMASEINPIGEKLWKSLSALLQTLAVPDDWLWAPAHYRTDTHGRALITVLSTFARFHPCNCSARSPMVTIARSSEPLLGCLFRLFARLTRGTERRPWYTHVHTHTHTHIYTTGGARWAAEIKMKFARG